MSTSANARNAAETSRRPSTSTGAKIRPPSLRFTAKERPFSSGEVIPEDSASNGPHRRSASGMSKINGSGRSFGGRQTERIHLTTRDNLQVQTRSPGKAHAGDDVEERSPTDIPSKQGSQAAERPAPAPRKEKKVLRELH